MSHKYIIDESKLKLGDIILTADKGLVSKGVRGATLSKYSHAAIYVGGTTIEATLSGVFSKNLQRLIFNSEKQVAVYRCRNELTEIQANNICNYARSKVASLYAIPEAATLKIRALLKKPESRKQFCSRLVALSYFVNGIDLMNLRYPAYCTPKQLSLCKAFYKVNDVVRVAEKGEIEFSKTEDPNAKHQKDTIDWVNKVRSLVNERELSKEYDIQCINDVDEFIKYNPEFDGNIVDYIRSDSYLTHYNFDVKRNPYRCNPILLEKKARSQANIGFFLHKELNKEFHIINLYSENLNKYLVYYMESYLVYYREHCILYMNLLTGIYKRMKFLNEVSEKLGDQYIAAESEIVMRTAANNCGIAKRYLGVE